MVARGNLMFLKQISAEKRSFKGKYACVNNIKFSRGSYQADTIVSRDQFKPIRIAENLFVSYHV